VIKREGKRGIFVLLNIRNTNDLCQLSAQSLMLTSGLISQFHLSNLLQIKALAAELCLDRALVLDLLRNPPPSLLMLSLSIPDEPKPSAVSPETTPGDSFYKETSADHAHAESGPKKSNLPIHDMQQNWSSRKRLKKAQLDTLERVYMRSKRPTVS
jgi:hypothetical protein